MGRIHQKGIWHPFFGEKGVILPVVYAKSPNAGPCVLFDTAEISWDNATIKMISPDNLSKDWVEDLEQEILFAHDPDTTDAKRIQDIIESKYCPADLNKIVAECKHLAVKSFFGRTELEYLGYNISREGLRPSQKKVEAILQIDTPKTRKQLRRFIGMVNYYRDMWPQRSHCLAPLSSLTSAKVKWKWTQLHQDSFEQMKALMAKKPW